MQLLRYYVTKSIFAFVLMLFFFTLSFSQAQSVIDSLTSQYQQAMVDTQRVILLRKIAYEYSNASNMGVAIDYAKKSLDQALMTKSNYQIYRCYLALGLFSSSIGKSADALNYYTQTLKYFDTEKNRQDAAFMYVKIAELYTTLENYKKSYEYFDKAVDLIRKSKDSIVELQILLSKVTTLVNDNNFKDAKKTLSYIDSVGSLRFKEWDRVQKLYILQNLWLIEINQRHYKEALALAYQSLELSEKEKNAEFIVSSNSLISKTFFELKDYKNARKYVEKVILGCISIGDNAQLMEHYIVSGDIYIKEKNYQLAQDPLVKAINLAKEGKIITSQIDALKKLSEVMEKLHKSEKSLAFFKEASLLQDSLTSNKTQNIISEVQTRTANEQNEKEIELLNKDKILKETQLREEQNRRNALYVGLLLVLIFAGFIFNRFRVTQKQKQIIEIKSKETEEQKHLIEEKHKEITDSINYAERIQRSFMATKEILDTNLKDYFVLFRPKDVVSGDFYWASNLNNGNFALVTADSTGHGVPGAIMSILNITSLEKAIEENNQPVDILNATRKIIVERLKKDGSTDGGKDGMDASITVYDFSSGKLFVAAANNPVWIVRGTETIEIKPDKMPVGKHDKETISFTQQEITLHKGDIVYTLTDGFPDQFGGEKGKKFMSKNLRELLIANTALSMQEQKILLEEKFNNWVGSMEQVDDVTIIGVKV